MIRYTLKCGEGHAFEAWFRSSDDYDKQADAGLLSCVHCGTDKVDKALMAPNLGKRQNRQADDAPMPVAQRNLPAGQNGLVRQDIAHEAQATGPGAPSPEMMGKMVELVRRVRAHVVKNGTDVGRDFADEARRIHFEEAPERLIYGETTPEEAKELCDDGVPIAPLPVLPEDHN